MTASWPQGPSLPGERWAPGDALADVPEAWPIRGSERRYQGFVSVREDTVAGPSQETFSRVVVEHPGAVGVLAVMSAAAEPGGAAEAHVLLLRQYRHATGARLLEIPAGLLDVPGEAPLDAAVRELAEEAGLRADSWSPLLRTWASPGVSDEHWHVYQATGLSEVPDAERAARVHEEADMSAVWVPLTAAVDAVLDGRLRDGMAVAALLAAHATGVGRARG